MSVSPFLSIARRVLPSGTLFMISRLKPVRRRRGTRPLADGHRVGNERHESQQRKCDAASPEKESAIHRALTSTQEGHEHEDPTKKSVVICGSGGPF